MATARQFEDLVLFSLTPDLSPVIENARILKAVSTASRATDKLLKQFLQSRLDFHPAEAGC
jgi:hypothetical protein